MYVLHCLVLSIRLLSSLSKKEFNDLSFKLASLRCWMPGTISTLPPYLWKLDVFHDSLLYYMSDRNLWLQTYSSFLSFDTFTERICLFSGLIDGYPSTYPSPIQSQIYVCILTLPTHPTYPTYLPTLTYPTLSNQCFIPCILTFFFFLRYFEGDIFWISSLLS